MEDTNFNKAFRERLLETFRFTIDFLESHNLKWCVAYGTAIGTVRHKGLIPWDDDIDIYMPREDYDKLFAMKSEFTNTNYDVVSVNDKDYYLRFGKIYDKTTSLWETHHFKYNIGVYIDVFPLDTIDEDNALSRKHYFEAKRMFEKYKFSLANINIKDIIGLISKRRFGTLYSWYSVFLKNAFVNSPKQLLKYNSFIKQHSNPEGRYCCSFASTASNVEIYPKEWFESFISVPFEDMTVKLPVEYDKYLRENYGDYMKLPPKEQQVPHHGQYYVNLKERLSLEEIEKRVKKGETRVY